MLTALAPLAAADPLIVPHIDLGTIVSVVSILMVQGAAAYGFVWALKTSVVKLDTKLTLTKESIDNRLTSQDRVIEAIETDLKELTKAITSLTVHQGGMEVLRQQIDLLREQMNERLNAISRRVDQVTLRCDHVLLEGPRD